MIKSKEKRDVQIHFYVSRTEFQRIQKKMEELQINSLSAYLRKMALDGYAVKLELEGIHEMISLMRYAGNNLNQYTKKAHQTGSIYRNDVEELNELFERLWEEMRQILSALSRVK